MSDNTSCLEYRPIDRVSHAYLKRLQIMALRCRSSEAKPQLSHAVAIGGDVAHERHRCIGVNRIGDTPFKSLTFIDQACFEVQTLTSVGVTIRRL
jgi:hypothetical protein